MIIYIFLIIIVMALLFASAALKDRNKKYFWGAFFLLWLVSGLRHNVGSDYYFYQEIYKYINDTYHLEWGFKWSTIWFRDFNIDFHVWLLTISFFTLYLIGRSIIRDSVEPELSFLLFILMGFYFNSMNAIRQYIAIALFMFSVKYIYNRKLAKFVFTNLIGAMFHISAIIVIPFYCIAQMEYKNKRLLFIWIISLFAIIFDIRSIIEPLIAFLPSFYMVYANTDFFLERSTTALFKLVVPNLMLCTLLLKCKSITEQRKKVLFNLFFVSVIGFNLFYGIQIILRILYYFEIFAMLIVPYFVYLFVPSQRKYIILALIIYYLSLLVLTIFILGGFGVVPYDYQIPFMSN